MNSVEICQKQGKSNQKIQYSHYCVWAQELMRKEIDPTKAQYGFPKSVHAIIRDISPGGIVGEIKESAYEVNLLIFCET